MSDTPRTDKLFDMVSDREQPDGGRWGDTPSKWSYEAVLDLTDFARTLERELAACREDAERWRRLMRGDVIRFACVGEVDVKNIAAAIDAEEETRSKEGP